MKNSERAFLGIVLAVLPLLYEAYSFDAALKIACFVAAAFWITAGFFTITRPLFPEKLLGISIILWIAAWTEAAQMYLGRTEFTPFCGLSLLLLLSPYFFRQNAEEFKIEISNFIQRALGFLILLTYLGASREIFRKTGTHFFDQPAGVLFLIAVAGWLWKNQPGARRKPLAREAVK